MPFQELSKRKRKDVKVEDIQVRVCLFAFDLLYLNGEVRFLVIDACVMYSSTGSLSCEKRWESEGSCFVSISKRSQESSPLQRHQMVRVRRKYKLSLKRASRTAAKALWSRCWRASLASMSPVDEA